MPDYTAIRKRLTTRSSQARGEKNHGHNLPSNKRKHRFVPVLLVLVTACILFIVKVDDVPLPRMTTSVMSQDGAKRGTLLASRRFPKYGTEAFSRKCAWTINMTQQEQANCTILSRPQPGEHEGISAWTAFVAGHYLLARQTGCNFLFDYGPDIDIHKVLVPSPKLTSRLDDRFHNWTVPYAGFDCPRYSNSCFRIAYVEGRSREIAWRLGTRSVPQEVIYRFRKTVNRTNFRDLERTLPGFEFDTGMACSLGALFHLAPSASDFEPVLFTKILPALQDKEALVMAVYIRSGQADVMANKEAGLQVDTAEKGRQFKFVWTSAIRCAQKLEQQYLSQEAFSRVVWMLVTDSQNVKEQVTEKYNVRNVYDEMPPRQQQNVSSQVIERQVLTTGSHGRHTRTRRNPSTADFAEALIDWYLIGESDLVVSSNAPSFSLTAAFRTARPLFDAKRWCSQQLPLHES